MICVGAELTKPHGRDGQSSTEKASMDEWTVWPIVPISLGLHDNSQASSL